MTHNQLVREAVEWLRDSMHCAFIAFEHSSMRISEIPDAIGWGYSWQDEGGSKPRSILVECKVSRADLLADKRKPHRYAEMGIGQERVFYAPEGIIKPEDLPEGEGWGLLERVSLDGSKRSFQREWLVKSKPREATIHMLMEEREFLISCAKRSCEAARLLKPFITAEVAP